MCLANENDEIKSAAKDPVEAEAPAPTPRSPWAKLLSKQLSKPKLSRKVVSSAKINLNKYWNKFGEMMSSNRRQSVTEVGNEERTTDADILSLLHTPHTYNPQESWMSRIDSQHHTQINNFKQRFTIEQDEIDDNILNEIREICYTQKENDEKLLCSLCCS